LSKERKKKERRREDLKRGGKEIDEKRKI